MKIIQEKTSSVLKYELNRLVPSDFFISNISDSLYTQR